MSVKRLLPAVAMLAIVSALWAYAAPQGPRVALQWEARLEALKPNQPMDYFELAEEIADVSVDDSERALARQLFALAGSLEPELLGRSACLALLDLEADEQIKHRLAALASLMGDGQFMQRTSVGIGLQSEPGGPAALAAAEALGHYRKGEGNLALKALERAGAQQLLAHYDRLLPGGIARFMEDCKHYKGQLKPTMSAGDITRMLRLEAALLAGGERSWSSEILLTGAQPLIEVDPTNLQETLGVDASKAYYRRGRWVERG